MNRILTKIDNFAGINGFSPLFYLDSSKWIDREIKNNTFEFNITHFIKNFLIKKTDSICVDVGANIGYYTILMSYYSNKVYSFEPVSEYFSILKNICIKNKIEEKTVLHNFALSSENKETNINVTTESATLHMLDSWKLQDMRQINKVLCFKMDDIINEKIDLIKIDCDGHDPFVIKGAENIIRKYKPIIVVEVAKSYYKKSGWSFNDFYSYISSLEYSINSEENPEKVLCLDEFVKKEFTTQYSSFDIFCKPKI